MKKIMGFILCSLVLAGCSAAGSSTVTSEKAQTNPAACEATAGCGPDEQQDKLPASFVEITMDDAIAMFQNKESGILYFGFPDCPWCKEVMPILEEQTQETGQTVYYVRTRDENKELIYTPEQKETITQWLNPWMSENEEGELTLYVPLVVKVENGTAKAGHVGTVDGHDAHERQMTEAEKEQCTAEIHQVLNA